MLKLFDRAVLATHRRLTRGSRVRPPTSASQGAAQEEVVQRPPSGRARMFAVALVVGTLVGGAVHGGEPPATDWASQDRF